MFKKRVTQTTSESNNSTTAPPTLIDLRQVLKIYDTPAGGFTALKNVDLQVNAGEFVAVIGKSGSGKSTLINMLTGIDRPTMGEVIVGGTPIHDLNEDQIAIWRGLNLGVIFQFFQLLPTLTVIENVMLPMELRHTYPQNERKARAMHLLEQVELVDQAHKFPSAISGGQQQRAAIARSLANDPNVLVGDEPTGSLDSKTADSIFRLFEDFVAMGKTVLIVTHDRELASRIPRVVFIADGEITDQYIASALPELEREELAHVLSQLEPIKYAPGQVIIQQNDVADNFYIIVRGEVDVILRHPSGLEVVTGHLKEGQYFGEIGLLEGGRRTATVQASSQSEVIVMQLSKENFSNLVADSAMTHDQIIHLMRQRVMEQYLSEAFPVLLPDQLDAIMESVTISKHQPGEIIVKQNTTADSLYIVLEGRVEVFDSQGQVIRELEPGQSFGERAILTSGQYSQNIRAIQAAKMMVVSYDAIRQISADLTEDSLVQMMTRRYLESTVGDFVPGLQRRKRKINLDFEDTDPPTQN